MRPVPRLLVSLLAAVITLPGCGGGGSNGDTDAVPDNPVPPVQTTGQPTNDPVNTPSQPPPELFALVSNGPLPATFNQSLGCDLSTRLPFTLVLDGSGGVQYSDNDGGTDSGSYQSGQSGLTLSFLSGATAVSTVHAVAGDLLVGVSLRDAESIDHSCIARAHSLGDKPTENVAFRCGRRNITGESANTFTLYTDGSADWQNVFELSDDTLFQTRLGTYLLDIASGTVFMAFKELDADELLVFTVAANENEVQVVEGPADGTGAGVIRQACVYI